MNRCLLDESPVFVDQFTTIPPPSGFHATYGVITITTAYCMMLLNQGMCASTTTKHPSWLSLALFPWSRYVSSTHCTPLPSDTVLRGCGETRLLENWLAIKFCRSIHTSLQDNSLSLCWFLNHLCGSINRSDSACLILCDQIAAKLMTLESASTGLLVHFICTQ